MKSHLHLLISLHTVVRIHFPGIFGIETLIAFLQGHNWFIVQCLSAAVIIWSTQGLPHLYSFSLSH